MLTLNRKLQNQGPNFERDQPILSHRYRRRYAVWTAILGIWLGVIFFSSTSIAGKTSDRAFSQFFAAYLHRFDKHDMYHQYHIHFLAEKNVHVMMFVVLAMLLWRMLPDTPGKVGIVFLSGVFIGCCSEVAQCFFPGRDPAVRDVLLNMAGTGIGTVISFSRLGYNWKLGKRSTCLTINASPGTTQNSEQSLEQLRESNLN